MAGTVDNPMEGNPLDRNVYLALIIAGIVILLRRKRVITMMQANLPIVLAFLYCAFSIFWSDYPDIAAKRWIKSVGDIVFIWIVLTDREPSEAIKELFNRSGFLLIPFSLLLIKYYPAMGRQYGRWTGDAMYNGVALTKNDMGTLCMLFGLSAAWQLMNYPRDRVGKIRILPIAAQGMILLMVLWLFSIVDSMTSLGCFVIGMCILVATKFRPIAQGRLLLHSVVAAAVLIPFSVLFLHVGMAMAHQLTDRNLETLTTRTDVWAAALKLGGNPFLGTGFQSFWLGHRLQSMWNIFWWQPNEAHNGYLEVFLNLGWIGVVILCCILAIGYRTVIARLRRHAPEGTLMLAFFVAALVYNFTEAAFFQMMAPVWFVLLLAIMAAPRPIRHKSLSSKVGRHVVVDHAVRV
jgi:O-antigen ligase